MEDILINDLLSIMVPCYNSGKYLPAFLESVCNQTDSIFQIIIADDGSTDDSSSIIESYRYSLSSKGIMLNHLRQPNKGQASAINLCIPEIKGEYVCWVDSDDVLDSRFVEIKKKELSSNRNIDVLLSKAYIHNEGSNEIIGKLGDNASVGTTFEDVLFSFRNLSPGLFATRTSFLMECLNNEPIIESRVGQNLQLVLPILYKSRIKIIDEYLYHYYVHPQSHSRLFKTGSDWKKRIDDILDLKKQILLKILMPDNYRDKLFRLLDAQSLLDRLLKVDEEIEAINPRYVENLCIDFERTFHLKPKIDKRKIMLWGTGKMSEIFNNYVEKYTTLVVDGYIDSNPEKQGLIKYGKLIIKPEDICKNEMFIIIPIGRDEKIIKNIEQKKIKNKEDYVYIRNDLVNQIKELKYVK